MGLGTWLLWTPVQGVYFCFTRRLPWSGGSGHGRGGQCHPVTSLQLVQPGHQMPHLLSQGYDLLRQLGHCVMQG